ncbi:restriction endonuclease subunit S [Vibrio parahaemolyticus]|uniref:restriction endonuclease subunit S n=1 Tax=Vibrio parahaemolyticus TaxID=670 RepID=UPI00111FF70F|nr:restriction endonuclease subunit S [Vibrio parahaemolyticus]TOP93655.1 type I restriction endonuclease subunit S [Vibrio parahaemolyticus]
MESLALMPKYEDYVDSGVEWLGDIPASWSLLANKHIFRLKKKQVGKRSNEYDLLSLTLRGVIKRDMENPEGKFPAEFDTYQEVQCGDFIFCLFDVEETPRTVGLSPFNGMITGAYTVFESNDNFDNRFLYYFYLNLDAKKRLKPLYRGLRNTIPKDSFLSFKTFIPPQDQQTRIANFLDKKTAQIGEAIAIKEKQISLLKERKQIIIQQAVTQGLDPNVPMKDSGVDWMGKIPQHWKLKPNKCLFKLKKSLVGKRSGDYELLSLTLKGIIKRDMDNPEGKFPAEFNTYQEVSVGDFVFCLFDVEETPRTVGLSKFNGMITGAYTVFELDESVSKEFLYYFYLNLDSRKMMRPLYKGLRNTISKETFLSFKSFIPPLKEQEEIVDFIEYEVNKIDLTIDGISEQIDKIKEYKSCLINGSVTGKIKVTSEMVEQ